jgi:cysteine desulfurase
MRSGTLCTPQIAGFAKAVELGQAERETESRRLTQLRDRLWQPLSQLEGIHLNGHPTQRLSGNLNISIEDVDGSALLLGLQSVVAVSSGAACSSVKTAPSHVLLALGHSEQLAYASVRFGIGRCNTADEMDCIAQHTIATIQSLRQSQSATFRKAVK